MAVVLALVFRSRLRLLPLVVALAAVAITFGAMSLLGASLTMASIAVLPVLLGLGGRLRDPVPGARRGGGGDAPRTARIAVPTIATAALATGVGFLVLLLSPVPMVRGFGVLLVVGVAIAFLLALTAGTAALAATARRRGGGGRSARSVRGAGELVDELGARACGACSRRCGGSAGALREAALRGALERPGACSLSGSCSRWPGWALDTQTKVVSDLRELVPQDLRGVRDLDALQHATGVAGEIDVLVQGEDLTDPKVVAWMRAYQPGVLKRYGYTAENGCGKADAVPGALAARPVPDGRARPRRRRASARCWTPCRRTSRRP